MSKTKSHARYAAFLSAALSFHASAFEWLQAFTSGNFNAQAEEHRQRGNQNNGPDPTYDGKRPFAMYEFIVLLLARCLLALGLALTLRPTWQARASIVGNSWRGSFPYVRSPRERTYTLAKIHSYLGSIICETARKVLETAAPVSVLGGAR